MCGFAGFVDFNGTTSIEVLREMADSMVHRGPDDAGYELIGAGNTLVGMGFRRLAIIDLSAAGHQPMYDSTRDYCIMFNGEIYNYRELRADLEKQGVQFRSNSDTEVILELYKREGQRAVDKFIGMFAIAIIDKVKNKLVLIRDRAGVKPLFYGRFGPVLLFASELKAFFSHPAFYPEIDHAGLSQYFFNGNIPAPYSIYKNVNKLEPGSWLEYDLSGGEVKQQVYWDVLDCYSLPNLKISYNDALSESEKLLTSAFQYRMVADVPVGVFLSGGYDSTAVAALLSDKNSNLKTYTIGFREKEYDESGHAESVARHLGTSHTTLHCSIYNAQEIIPDLPFFYDEPFGDSSAIPTTLVSRLARKHVTVALSADAGDELLAGYPRHRKFAKYNERLMLLPKGVRKFMASLLPLRDALNSIEHPDRRGKLKDAMLSSSETELFHVINQTFTRYDISALLKGRAVFGHSVFDFDKRLAFGSDALNKVLAVEYKSYLVDDILQKVDRATMSCSLEGREPFLDHRLVEFFARIPSGFKLEHGTSKRLLKDIVHQYVPTSIMDRPKMGFGVPVARWMKNELRDVLEDVIHPNKLLKQDIIDSSMALRIKSAYLEGRLHDFERLWFLFAFLQWQQRWMK